MLGQFLCIDHIQALLYRSELYVRDTSYMSFVWLGVVRSVEENEALGWLRKG